ncbi:MAG: hypothetical protein ACLP3K_13385 [Candidatus Acidiferrales bacterium]
MFRISDLHELDDSVSEGLVTRLHDCHIYLPGKRPLISVLPESIEVSDDLVRFVVEYKREGIPYQSPVEIPRKHFTLEEVSFEASPYPRHELVTRDANGVVFAHTFLSNYVDFMTEVPQWAKDLEVKYVGKGLRRSANDRLANHPTLQKIQAKIHTNDPDSELFAIVHAFSYQKDVLTIDAVLPEIIGEPSRQRTQKVLAYKPSLDEQVSLIEATVIAYFKPAEFNRQYLDFPKPQQRILRNVQHADFAALAVYLDNTNLGGPRLYSKTVAPSLLHEIVVDFRDREGRFSHFRRY